MSHFSNNANPQKQSNNNAAPAAPKEPIDKLRAQCLARGATGIKGFARQFHIIDDDGNRKLSKQEFMKGCRDFGCTLTDAEMSSLFITLDKDNSGSVDFDEFLRALRPPMSQSRVAIIEKAFKKMDKTGDGIITVADLKGSYNARLHPKYQNGQMDENQVFQLFLKTFEAPETADGQVTFEEFMNYYSAISASVDTDTYFDLMMRNAFKL